MELVGPEIPIKEMSKEEIETRWFNMLRKIGKAFNNCLDTLKDNSIIIDKNLSYNVIKTKVKKILVEKNIEQLHPFKTALTISILNPKAILFYLSFFVQFVDPAYPYPAITFAALALVLQIISMSYLTILIFSGAKLATYFTQRYKVTASCVAAVGLLFCGFGIKLATSTL